MIRTKELYEQTQPVSLEEQVAFNTFNKEYHYIPRFDDENDEYDYYREMQEEQEQRMMNDYWESFNG